MAVDRRKMIIEAANQSFALFGYKATTMDLVSKTANVGKGTIYTFFQTKEDLFREVMGMFLTEMKAEAEDAIDPDQPFIENVHSLIYRLLKFRSTHQLTAKLLFEAKEIGTPAVLEAIDETEKGILNFVSEKVSKAIHNKEIRECDPEMTAFILLKLYMAFIFDWEKNHQPLPKEKIAELFELYLYKGLSI